MEESNIDFIAKAPDGKEVEELTNKELKLGHKTKNHIKCHYGRLWYEFNRIF